MLEIFKAESPKILPYIAEKFENIEGLDVETAVETLLIRVASQPETTGVFVIFDGEELVGFLFGWMNGKTVWLNQAWSDPDIQHEYKQEIFDKFCDWGKSLGATDIQAQTQRANSKVWKRLYDLNEHAIILRKEL